MKRYLKYILLALIATFTAASCIEEMQFEQPVPQGDELTLVPRVKSFANEYVTKATEYDANEKKITGLAVLVFNSDGNLVYWDEPEDVTASIKLNKSMLNNPAQAGKLADATVVMIANVSLDDIKTGTTSLRDNISNVTLDDMEDYTCHIAEGKTVITSLGDGFTGFPMIGGVKGVNLEPTASQQSAIEVGMKILYAKINFSIAVADGTENAGTGMQFALSEYSVHNTSAATTLAIPANKGQQPVDFLGNAIEGAAASTVDGATASTVYEFTTAGAAGNTTGTATLGGNPVTFTFYVSESRYNHNSDLKGIYPSDDWLISSTNAYDEDVKGYSSMSDADKAKNPLNGVKYFYDDIIQQYKPKLAAVSTGKPAAGLATYVLLNGTYTDYRGATWTVDYKVYLGKDNAHNFHVDRNSIYTNNITIKGIRNNSSFGGGNQEVWVDHRVNVTDASGAANHVTITRETLIDSHIEVRPLRVDLPSNVERALLYLPKYNGSQINETATGVNQNWIAIENNNGRIKDLTRYCANGKRKYFTTSLIKELHLENTDEIYGVKTNNSDGDARKGLKFIQMFDGDCAWIYIDENATENSRDAIIELVFYDADDNQVAEESYKITQTGLEKAGGYYIENYEEYLHSYDSADKYNITTSPTDYTQQGLAWGFPGQTISEDIIVSATQLEGLGISLQDIVARFEPYYDYFHMSDIPAGETYYPYINNGSEWVVAPYGTGLTFTDRATTKKGVTIKDMGTIPENAYQYCLSKNKFKEDDDGNHTLDIHWYLPDVYELQAVLNANQNAEDFGADAYYWSSQPAENGGSISILGYELSIKDEDADNARAVSKSDKSVDLDRTTKHRIRCFYDAKGITADMTDRVPDGVGGNFKFYMRAWEDWTTKKPGYFHWGQWLKQVKSKNEDTGGYTMANTFAFPKVASDDPYEVFGGYKDGWGFKKDPSDPNNWKTEDLLFVGQVVVATNQITLGTWPGLTLYDVVQETLFTGATYFTTDGDKKESRGTTNTNYIEYDGDITSDGLKPLGHLSGNNDLSIAFSKGADATYSPIYEYYKDSTITANSTTRTWMTPTYKENVEYATTSYSLRTPSGQVQLTSTELSDYNSRADYLFFKKSRSSNENGYIYATAADAIAAGNSATQAINNAGDIISIPSNVTKSVTTESQNVLIYTYYTKSGSGWSPKYEKTEVKATRYRYRIQYTIQGDKNSYYEYKDGGEWNEVTNPTQHQTITDAPSKDQLVMYGGNSFTITANNGNEISSVKIYFSGSNVVDELGSGHDYLRFTKDGFTGSSNENPPGMSYSGNGDTGTMTWNGDPQTELTFKLVLLRNTLDNYGLWGEPTSFQYLSNNDDSKKESIVIDQIDVRYKKIQTTN